MKNKFLVAMFSVQGSTIKDPEESCSDLPLNMRSAAIETTSYFLEELNISINRDSY